MSRDCSFPTLGTPWAMQGMRLEQVGHARAGKRNETPQVIQLCKTKGRRPALIVMKMKLWSLSGRKREEGKRGIRVKEVGVKEKK
jgi:hypothetical protein